MPSKPHIFTRYVNNIFLLSSNIKHLGLFQQFTMNSHHANIKFTTEAEQDNQLAFLDINMTRHSLLLGTYGKPKFSSLYTNYNSCIPSEYKTGLVAATLD